MRDKAGSYCKERVNFSTMEGSFPKLGKAIELFPIMRAFGRFHGTSHFRKCSLALSGPPTLEETISIPGFINLKI
jgi:hypothetical protein